jgi:hypothetical protein
MATKTDCAVNVVAGDLCENAPSMADWIKERAKALLDDDERKRLEQESQMRRDKLVQANGRKLLDDLTNAVEADVNHYHQEMPGERNRVDFHKNPSGGFELSKSHYPAAHLECKLDASVGILVVDYAFTPSATSGTHETVRHFTIQSDEADNLILSDGSAPFPDLRAASRVIIEKVLFPD